MIELGMTEHYMDRIGPLAILFSGPDLSSLLSGITPQLLKFVPNLSERPLILLLTRNRKPKRKGLRAYGYLSPGRPRDENAILKNLSTYLRSHLTQKSHLFSISDNNFGIID